VRTELKCKARCGIKWDTAGSCQVYLEDKVVLSLNVNESSGIWFIELEDRLPINKASEYIGAEGLNR
jgi:hypothetical protein